MSFVILGAGNVRFGLKITGYNETLANLDAIKADIPKTAILANREGAVDLVKRARTRVHKISHNLENSIRVENPVTPAGAIASANMPYAKKEEERKGIRRIPPHTPHPYMKPSGAETSQQMPGIVRRNFGMMFSRHQARII